MKRRPKSWLKELSAALFVKKRVIQTPTTLGIGILVACYLIAATDVIYVASDWLAPISKTVSNPDFPCAQHECGCMTAEQCRDDCCCFPKAPAAQVPASYDGHQGRVASKTVKVTYLASARCSGRQPGNGLSGGKSPNAHLLTGAPPVMPLLAVGEELIPTEFFLPSVFPDPPDKVPIYADLA